MRDHGSWSISLGCWGGVYVRLHMFFLLFTAGTLYLNWLDNQTARENSLTWVVWASLGILLVSVLLHEIGHIVAARRFGGIADEIVLWPLGGLASPRLPLEPQSEFVTSLAGPLVNLLICGVVCFPILVLQIDRPNLVGLLNPLDPTIFAPSATWLVVVKLVFWINWVLFVLNLLPAYPFDGGRALRAAMLMFWARMDRRAAGNIVALVAKCCAAGLLGMSLLIYQQPATGPVPAWFALLILAIFIYFSAKQEEYHDEDPDDDEVPFGYDFSQGYTSLERSADPPHTEQSGPFLRWLDQRREARQRRQMEVEAEEEKRVDEILARLHNVGMENLSPDERSILQRVSTRYRNRHNKA